MALALDLRISEKHISYQMNQLRDGETETETERERERERAKNRDPTRIIQTGYKKKKSSLQMKCIGCV